MLHSLSKYDKRNDGCILTTLEVDFSDIVDIIWAEEGRMIPVRSRDGELSKDIELRSRKTVILWIETVEKGRDRHYCIEPMMQEKSRYKKDAGNPQRILIPLYGTGCRLYL
jgi:hypothetical protein